MAILPITVYGDKILRKHAKKVEKVDDNLIALITDMFQTMRHASGVGLAANQVNVDKSLFVIDISELEDYEHIKPIVMINPEIIDYSDEIVTFEEGCLSLPTLRADVERPDAIKVRFMDADENIRELEADDFFARVILHENDHLLGKMIPDRVNGEIKKKLQRTLAKIQKRNIDIDYLITDK